MKMGQKEWMLLVLLSVLWGSSFFFIEVALRELPIFTIVFARVAIAALLLTVYLYFTGQAWPNLRRLWPRFIVLGALRAAIPISLIVWAETQIDSGLAGILNSTSPLFTALIAHRFTTDDQLTPQRLLGIIIGMLGVGVLIGLDAIQGFGSHIIAQFAMLGATCSYGLAAVYGRQFKHHPPAGSAAGMLIGAACLVFPLAILEQPWHLQPSLSSLGAIIGLSFMSTALAFILWFKLIFSAGPSNTAMVTFLIPITALILGIFVLGEGIDLATVIGLVIILFGLAIAQNRIAIRPKRAAIHK
jgi:drug/metabolite transporter (DMT)-like permease